MSYNAVMNLVFATHICIFYFCYLRFLGRKLFLSYFYTYFVHINCTYLPSKVFVLYVEPSGFARARRPLRRILRRGSIVSEEHELDELDDMKITRYAFHSTLIKC